METDSGPAEAIWFRVRRNGVAKRDVLHGDVALSDPTRWVGARSGDVIEVCAAHDFRPVAPDRFSRVFCNRARGLVGMEITYRGEVFRLAPTRMLAGNVGFKRALEEFLEQRNASADDFAAEGSLRVFSARQFLLRGDGEGGAERTELFRGATLVAPTPDGNENRAGDLADGIGSWMFSNLSAEGSLAYKYWPSRGRESPADNAIRRFLASLSLARLGKLRGSPEIREAALSSNLRFNLSRYFRNIGSGRASGSILHQVRRHLVPAKNPYR